MWAEMPRHCSGQRPMVLVNEADKLVYPYIKSYGLTQASNICSNQCYVIPGSKHQASGMKITEQRWQEQHEVLCERLFQDDFTCYLILIDQLSHQELDIDDYVRMGDLAPGVPSGLCGMRSLSSFESPALPCHCPYILRSMTSRNKDRVTERPQKKENCTFQYLYILKILILLLFTCLCEFVCMCIVHSCQWSPKRASDSLELGLQVWAAL